MKLIDNGARKNRRIMPEARPRHVFVYGTLRRGGRNDINRLAPAPEYVGPGSVRGVLHALGGYPGLVLGGAGAVDVAGEVYLIAPPLEAVLDAIEEIVPGPRSEYFKREVAIEVAGQPLVCLVYEVNPVRARGRPVIAQGDWMRFHAS
jgi:gamma-glutamylcyclotransferase (GGCT)/AIG2-like uncharacterized protein YtfP